MPSPSKGPRLGGGPAHERHILANLATALFEHDSITTTEARAKRVRPLAERLVTFAKRGDLHARRRVMTTVRDKGVVHRLFVEIAPDMAERPGGYTRIGRDGSSLGGLFLGGPLGRAFGLLDGGLLGRHRLANELDHGHRGVVALAEAVLEDAEVASIALGVARARFGLMWGWAWVLGCQALRSAPAITSSSVAAVAPWAKAAFCGVIWAVRPL